MPLDRQGRSVGDAFIQFVTVSDADKSLTKHKEKMGRRWVIGNNGMFDLLAWDHKVGSFYLQFICVNKFLFFIFHIH